MAVQRRVNFLSQARVDVPDMRAIESSVANDFDQLFQGFVTGTTQGYIMRGFNILMAGSIGGAASSLQMQVDPGAVLHIAASQSGTILMVPAGTAAQTLNSATNTNVTGAFTPSSINYVTIDYIRFIDPTTSAQVYIWDPTSNTETTKIAPRASILQFVINISTSTPTPNQLPVATVLTDAANLVVSITDARWMFCSLGTGGLSPNLSFSYPWTQGRTLNPVTSSSDSIDPFTGGDKSIGSLKELLNAMLTTLKEIKGTPYWFTGSSLANIPAVYQNAALNVLSGGTWVSPSLGHLELKGGSQVVRFGFANSLVLSPFGPISSTESLTATVSGNTVVTLSTPAIGTNHIGDTVTIGAVTLDINTVISQSVVDVDEPGFTNGSGQAATLTHFSSFDLTSEQVLYILIPTSDVSVTYGYGADGTTPILPKQVTSVTPSTITVATGGNYATGAGNILAHGQSFSYTSYNPGTGVFAGISPNPVSVVLVGDYIYQLDNAGIGYYHFSSPSAVPGKDNSLVSLGAERVMWLAFYDGSSNIFLRNEKLSAGESIAVGDTLSTAILSYIGMPNQSTNNPTYSSDIRGVARENLTLRAGYLTDAIGDEQEDRSAYFYSGSQVNWAAGGVSGGTVTFTSNIVLFVLNTKSGTITSHTILTSSYPSGITLNNGQLFYVSISRTTTSENITGTIASSLPAQTESTKDIFVLFQAQGTNLVLPFNKQLIPAVASQTVSFSIGAPVAGFNQAAIVGDLLWSTDGGGNIGTASNSRPDKIWAKTSITSGGQFFSGIGTSSNPSYTATLDGSTGMNLLGGQQIQFVAGSTLKLFISPTQVGIAGNLLWLTDGVGDIGASSASRPNNAFIKTNLTVGSQIFSAAGTSSNPSYSISTNTNTGLNLLGGNVVSITAGGTDRLFISPTQVTVENAQFRTDDGTAAAPAISFSAETNSGIWRIGSANLGVSIAGTNVLNIKANGLGISTAPSIEGDSGTYVSLVGTTGHFEAGCTATTTANSVIGDVRFFNGSNFSGQLSCENAVASSSTSANLYLKTSNAGTLGIGITISNLQKVTIGSTGGTQTHVVNGNLSIINTTDSINSLTGNTSQVWRFLHPAASGEYNFQIGRFNAANTWEITPSTVVDGTLFTAPMFTVNASTGVTTIGANNSGTVQIGSSSGPSLISGGTYTFTVTAANATDGAIYTNNGQSFRVTTTISSGTTLTTTGLGFRPTASGTLTKASGTGDATITFSSFVFSADSSLIVSGPLTRGSLPTVGQQTSSNISFSTSSNTYVDVTAATVTITTTGRPVIIVLQSSTSVAGANVFVFGTTGSSASGMNMKLVRDSTDIASWAANIQYLPGNGAQNSFFSWPASGIFYFDTPAAGTHTYKLQQHRTFGTESSVGIDSSVLVAYEL